MTVQSILSNPLSLLQDFTPPVLDNHKIQQTNFTNSSISMKQENYLSTLQAKENFSPFAPPILSSRPDTLVEFSLLQAMEELCNTNKELLLSSTKELQLSTQMVKECFMLQAEVLKSTHYQVFSSELFSWTEKMSTCFLSAFYITYGSALLQAGSPILGATLIASAAASLSCFTLQEMQGLENLSACIAQGNAQLQEQITNWLPFTIQTFSLALGTATSPAIYLSASQTPSLMQALSSLTTGAHLVKEIGNAGRDSAQVRLSAIDGDLSIAAHQKEAVSTWLKSFMESLHGEWTQAKNVIELSIQTSRGIHGAS